MKKRFLPIIILVLLLAIAAFYIIPIYFAHSTALEKTASRITPSRYKDLLGVGIDVDWMSFKRVHDKYFEWRSKGVNVPLIFKKRGFSNVRIRVGYDVVKNPQAINDLDAIVHDCLKAGIIPIIAYNADELRENPDSPLAQKHFLQWWLTVARHFRNTSYLLSYDLIIETGGNLKDRADILNKLYREVITEIRRIDKYRIIIITPPKVSSPFHLDDLDLPNDSYIMAEWHIYAGGPKPPTRGAKTIFNKTLIDTAVAAAKNWTEKTGIPTWVGAWRPNRYPKESSRKAQYPDGAPKGIFTIPEAITFSKYMCSKLTQAGIPYDINADALFLDYNTLQWYPSQRQILDTIIHCYNH